MQNEFVGQLVEEVSRRFAMSADASGKLLGILGHLIFDEGQGGVLGFVQRLHDKGLGGLVQGWLSGDSRQELDGAQVERVLGSGTLDAIGRVLDLPAGKPAAAIGSLLPKLFAGFNANGSLIDAAPAGLLGTMAGVSALLPTLRGASAPVVAARKSGARRWWWLLLLLLLVAASLLLRQCIGNHQPAEVVAAPPVKNEAPAEVAKELPRLMLDNRAGKVVINGQLASIDERARLLEGLKAAYGAENISGDVSVKGGTSPAAWLDGLLALLPQLKVDGLKLGFNGERIRVDSTALTDSQRIDISEKLRASFGGFEFLGLWNRALAALAELKPGFTGGQLVGALNQLGITFDTNSNSISRDSDEVLAQAAEAIRHAPAGTRVEVGGHTDDSGDERTNQQVSQARADAVVARLQELGVDPAQLLAKGYGRSRPVADNATEEGKARNRRIEFTVLQ
ncbi:OmpA family protein [Pseudomonas citronellolis]|uniref:OmpA family protein n=1 Tax=Pseudomonas citronellolis TaxID=53408 RepID=UPI0023E39557|nr:OmpA family protein [Pseudomonas citronellolis]MDF3936051.1 OmpA family protein [Pseudomonas citronellolis]